MRIERSRMAARAIFDPLTALLTVTLSFGVLAPASAAK